MSTASNAVPHLHDEAYGRAYDTRTLDHRGLITMAGRDRQSLAGPWLFTRDPFQEGLRQKWHRDCFLPLDGRTTPWDYDIHGSPTLPVPSCWNLQEPELMHYEGTAWLGRWLDGMAARPGERVFLRVGAAPYDAKVFLDGVFLGNHLGASTPFFVELTGVLRERSFLHLCLDNTRTAERVPMHHIDWFNYGGLFREVDLVRLPQRFIKDLFVRLTPDGRAIAVDVALSEPVDATVEIAVPELGLRHALAIREGHGSTALSATPERWSPDRPRLYEVTATQGADTVRERIGFRTIEAKGRDILLNGEPVFLKGICVHEDDTAGGRVATDADIARRLAHAKELGCNLLRLAHYPHHERTAELADAAGVMLWEEIPVYWAIDFANPATLADATNQLRELILRDRNRASVAIWGVGNENADTDARLAFMAQLAAVARAADGSRPVSAACLVNKKARRIEDRLVAHLDIVGINEYYGWYEPDVADLAAIARSFPGDKPIVITEVGAEAPAGHRTNTGALFTEERMAAVYAAQVAQVAGLPEIKGFCPWLLYDFRSERRHNRWQGGFNRKGLIADDKATRKAAFAVLQRFYDGPR